jgi:hypothetical protein
MATHETALKGVGTRLLGNSAPHRCHRPKKSVRGLSYTTGPENSEATRDDATRGGPPALECENPGLDVKMYSR